MNKFSQKNKSLLKNKKSKKNIKKIYRQTKINKIIGGSNTIVSVNSNFNEQNVKKIIEFIKKNMLYKNKNNSNTNNSLFDTYTNDKYIQKNYGFNSRHFQISMDKNLIFQRLTDQELVLLSALDHLSK